MRALRISLVGLLLSFVTVTTFAAPSLLQQAITNIQGSGAQNVPPPASVEIAFSPDGGATALVVKAIRAAKHDIKMAAYSFTSRPIADALADAHRTGVDVEIVIDHDQLRKDEHSAVGWMAAQNIPVRVDIVHALQHDKYMVIDGKTVETGSFNYTFAAEQHNSENVIVLWDAPKLAAAYAADWQSLWDKAEKYSPMR
jgi:phosphatidylserine/phosphatidylglycerophosphate/cardiolipin synthase-like enzyme